MAPDVEENTNSGHRERLLKRFEASGIGSLADYEIVELLLTYVHPRRDVKPISKRLLGKYGTISAVFNAMPQDLRMVKGVGPRTALLFALIKDLLSYCLKEKYQNRPLMAHRADVEEYLRFHFGPKKEEYVAALFLDTGHRVAATDILAEGTVNQCAIYPRSVIERAMRSGAASFILVHNHPGGGKDPSEADWSITHRLYEIGDLLEIPLLDHIIITREAAFSLRDLSRWPQTRKQS
jgi:DNA repair protein RadC